MADEDQATATPTAPSGMDQASIDRYLAMLQAPPPNIQPDQTPVDTSGFWGGYRHGVSLLGEALAGGKGTPGFEALSPTQRQAAGIKALMDFSSSLGAASHYQPGQTIFSNLAQGFQGASRSYQSTEQQAAGELAARQSYATDQQANQLARIKEALPLLTLKQQQQAADTARRIALGGPPNVGTVGADTYVGAIGGHEGDGKNPNSSATGPGQFIDSTWNSFAQENPDFFKGMSPQQVLDARKDSTFMGKVAPIAIEWLAKKNADDLTNSGITPSGQSLGIAHYLGSGVASSIMRAPDNAPVSGFVSAAALAANPELARMTVGQMKARYANTPNPAFMKTATAPTPGQTATATPPPVPGYPAQVSDANGISVPTPNVMPDPGKAPVPVAPPVQVAGPGAGNAPPGTSAAPVDPAAAPAAAPPLDLSTFQPVRGQLPPDSIYNPDLTPAEIAARTKQSQIEAVGLNPTEALAKIQGDIAAAQTAKRAAAEKAVQEFRAAETTRQFEAAKLAAAQRDQIGKEQREAAQKEQEQQAQHQRALELEKQKSVFNIDQEGAKAAFAADKTRLDKMGEGAAAMLPVGDQLRQLRPVLSGLPDAGVVSSVLGAYPQLTAAARMGGVITPDQADNVQLFLGLTNHLAGQLRISGSGSMSDKDLETFKSTLPQLVTTKEGRIKAAAFLQNISDRIVDEHDFAQQYFRRVVNGKPSYNLDNLRQAINAPRDVDATGVNRGGLGPVIPQAPNHAGQSYDSMTAWIRNNVDVGHPYMGWGYPRDPRSGLPMPVNPKTGKANDPVLQLMVREQ